ncbi:MAG: cysteine--tRNA ligase [Nitrososphaera sp.]|uniref:cysteine--tRNA ligase n=1 Tax=Nitrososphaera sp. TaxID=1971748 RepID=UPI003D6FD394
MKLYNTLSRTAEELQPNGNSVRIYVCGVTVYDSSHIGHARTIIVFDVLRRYLMSKGYSVKFVQNFTDVDDKIINRAKKEGKSAEEISKTYIDAYYRDFAGLNVLKADQSPKATEHIGDMIRLIQGLVEKGHAYLTLNGVYFRVKSFAGYGKLSRKPVDELEAGARIEIDQSKEDPMDFALWKFYSEPPAWDSPWGKGRPGWHIECSAMALKYLGDTFEIHGGGHDLVFPHHENEIAQSESFTGKQYARLWMHSGMVTINSQKMSKSLGNIVSIDKALKAWGMNALRLYCLSVHYAKPLDYADELLIESAQRWRQIETCAYELRAAAEGGDAGVVGKLASESEDAFGAAMDGDMNTSLALTEFLKFVTKLNQLAASDRLTGEMANAALPVFEKIMGILGLATVDATEQERKEIEEMVATRNSLRAEKKFKEADDVRKRLLERSVELMDHKGRTVWKRVERPER